MAAVRRRRWVALHERAARQRGDAGEKLGVDLGGRQRGEAKGGGHPSREDSGAVGERGVSAESALGMVRRPEVRRQHVILAGRVREVLAFAAGVLAVALVLLGSTSVVAPPPARQLEVAGSDWVR